MVLIGEPVSGPGAQPLDDADYSQGPAVRNITIDDPRFATSVFQLAVQHVVDARARSLSAAKSPIVFGHTAVYREVINSVVGTGVFRDDAGETVPEARAVRRIVFAVINVGQAVEDQEFHSKIASINPESLL